MLVGDKPWLVDRLDRRSTGGATLVELAFFDGSLSFFGGRRTR